VHTATEAGSRTRRCMLRSCGRDHADFYAAVVDHDLNCTDLHWIRDAACWGDHLCIPRCISYNICNSCLHAPEVDFHAYGALPALLLLSRHEVAGAAITRLTPPRPPRGPPNPQHTSLASDRHRFRHHPIPQLEHHAAGHRWRTHRSFAAPHARPSATRTSRCRAREGQLHAEFSISFASEARLQCHGSACRRQ